jgi:hypothetical protein
MRCGFLKNVCQKQLLFMKSFGRRKVGCLSDRFIHLVEPLLEWDKVDINNFYFLMLR